MRTGELKRPLSALAREAALQSSLRVKLVDLDTMQKTTSDWHAERLKAHLKPVCVFQANRSAIPR